MESPHREAEPGQQEQELRQILNKDKSKRSKGSLRPGGDQRGFGGVLPLPRPSSAFPWGKGVGEHPQSWAADPAGTPGMGYGPHSGDRPRWDPQTGFSDPQTEFSDPRAGFSDRIRPSDPAGTPGLGAAPAQPRSPGALWCRRWRSCQFWDARGSTSHLIND